jgi:hypothetical protein
MRDRRSGVPIPHPGEAFQAPIMTVEPTSVIP